MEQISVFQKFSFLHWHITLHVCLQRPHKATQEEMTKFHSDDYIKFLRSIRPDNMSEYNKQMQRCEFSRDCCLRIYKDNN